MSQDDWLGSCQFLPGGEGRLFVWGSKFFRVIKGGTSFFSVPKAGTRVCFRVKEGGTKFFSKFFFCTFGAIPPYITSFKTFSPSTFLLTLLHPLYYVHEVYFLVTRVNYNDVLYLNLITATSIINVKEMFIDWGRGDQNFFPKAKGGTRSFLCMQRGWETRKQTGARSW